MSGLRNFENFMHGIREGRTSKSIQSNSRSKEIWEKKLQKAEENKQNTSSYLNSINANLSPIHQLGMNSPDCNQSISPPMINSSTHKVNNPENAPSMKPTLPIQRNPPNHPPQWHPSLTNPLSSLNNSLVFGFTNNSSYNNSNYNSNNANNSVIKISNNTIQPTNGLLVHNENSRPTTLMTSNVPNQQISPFSTGINQDNGNKSVNPFTTSLTGNVFHNNGQSVQGNQSNFVFINNTQQNNQNSGQNFNTPNTTLNQNQNFHTNMQETPNFQQNMQNQQSPNGNIPPNNQFQSDFYSQPNGFSVLNPQVQLQIQTAVNMFLLPFFQRIQQGKCQQELNQRRNQNMMNNNGNGYFMQSWYNNQTEEDYAYRMYKKKKNSKKNNIEIKIIENNCCKQKEYVKKKEQQLKNLKKNPYYEYEQYQKENKVENMQPKFNFELRKSFINNERNSAKKKNLIKERHQYNLDKNSTYNLQVSDFGSTVKLEYTVDLRWHEESDKIIQKYPTSTVQVSEKPTYMQIYETILMDLKSKGYKFEKGIKLKMKECFHKKYSPNLFSRLLLGKKEEWTKDYCYVGSLLRRKITMPEGYQFAPKHFKGFLVRNFTISNKYGKIEWPGLTNLEGVDFKDQEISIFEDKVECRIPQLQKQAIIQFYNLPQHIKELKYNKEIENELKKMLASSQMKFIELDAKTKSWTVEVNFADLYNDHLMTQEDK